jgi:hypothetical protein
MFGLSRNWLRTYRWMEYKGWKKARGEDRTAETEYLSYVIVPDIFGGS